MAYTSMQNAFRMVGKRVSLVGIVVEFTLPRETQGTDYGCKVRIVDPSRQENVLTVQFLLVIQNGCLESIPTMISSVCGMLRLQPFKKISLPRSIKRDLLLPYLMEDLKQSLLIRLHCHLGGSLMMKKGVNKFTRQLKEIEEEEVGDLICKVIHVCEIHEGWFLFVWDGTDCPPVNMSTSLRSDDALPPLQSEEVELGKLALENLPRFGTVLRVRIDKSFEGLYINLRTIGEWVKLRSLTFKVQSDRWYAELTHNSTMRLLTEETSIVIEWMREYTARLEPN